MNKLVGGFAILMLATIAFVSYQELRSEHITFPTAWEPTTINGNDGMARLVNSDSLELAIELPEGATHAQMPFLPGGFGAPSVYSLTYEVNGDAVSTTLPEDVFYQPAGGYRKSRWISRVLTYPHGEPERLNMLENGGG